MDVAVIGIASRLPGASDFTAYRQLLREGRVAIGPIATRRIAACGLPVEASYMTAGYLDDIDRFDAGAFGLDDDAAAALDPQQRLGLEIAVEAIEDAGYVPFARKARTSVFCSIEPSLYLTGIEEPTPSQRLGNIGNMFAARLADRLGLTGAAAVVEAACSSSLLALHLACNELRLGQSAQALVVAVNIHPVPVLLPPDGMRSHDGLSRSYSDAADGMSYGEAALAVLLKPLAAAIDDGDDVRAVIKSSAAVHNGGRAFSLTAPDSEAIADVIDLTWTAAGLDLAEVEYFEGHGAGTKLGDTLELEGYARAVAPVRDRRTAPVPVAAAKSAIGHGQTASGLASFVRAVACIQDGIIYPTPLAEPLTSMIDVQRKGLAIVTTPQPFATPARLVGVTNLGLSGTNVHVILGAPPPRSAGDRPSTGLFVVNADDAGGLTEALRRNGLFLADRGNPDIADICFTSVHGRPRGSMSRAFVAPDAGTLAAAIEARMASPPTDDLVLDRLFYLADGNASSIGAKDRLATARGRLAMTLDGFAQRCGFTPCAGDDAAAFVILAGLYIALRDMGLTDLELVPVGRASLVAQSITGAKAPAEAYAEWHRSGPASADARAIASRLQAALDGRSALVVSPVDGTIATAIAGLEDDRLVVSAAVGDLVGALDRIAADVINHAPDKTRSFVPWTDGRRTSIPGRHWQRRSFWLQRRPPALGLPATPIAATSRQAGTAHPGTVTRRATPDHAIDRRISALFADVLGQAVGPDTDFFDAGGTSLKAAQFCLALGDVTGKTYPLSILLEHRSIRSLDAALCDDLPAARIPSPMGDNGRLVTLRRGDPQRAPLFLVHAMGGQVVQYADLAGAFPTGRPIVGIEATMPCDGDRLAVEQMAADYACLVLDRQPHGPHVLAGHSFGGILALETARRLGQATGLAPMVGLLDSGFDWPMPGGLVRRVLTELPFLASAGALVLTSHVRERAALRGLPDATRIREIQRQVNIARRAFEIRPVSFAPVLFAARGGPSRNSLPDYGWSRYAPGITVIDVRGNHMSMLQPPHVAGLAAALAAAADAHTTAAATLPPSIREERLLVDG